MKELLISAALLTAAGVCSAAAGDAPKLLMAPPPESVSVGRTVLFRTAAGYHFNLKAPQDCGPVRAFDVTEGSLRCRFDVPGRQNVSLKICAENESSCMFENFEILVKGAPAAKSGKTPAPAASGETPMEGFLLNSPGKALAEAVKERKPLFIDFFAKWCPPCRLMESTVLDKPQFLEASSGMVRVSMDIDKPSSREWMKRFGVRAFPTYLVADPQLREIGRWLGSGSLPAFSAWVKDQRRWKDLPIAEAEAKVSSLDGDGRLRVAKARLGEKEWKAAMDLLSGIKTREAEFLYASAQVSMAENDAKKDVKASTGPASPLVPVYRDAIARFDGSDGKAAEADIMEWVGDLYKLDPAAAKPWLDELPVLVKRFLLSKETAAEGYAPADIYVTVADMLDDAGLSKEAAPYYLEAARDYASQAAKASNPERAKGLRYSQARYLLAAGRTGEAASVYGELARRFPGEYAFHRAYASALTKLGKYPEALREARLAEKLSYGDVRYGIMMQMAKIQLAHEDRPGAVKTLMAALSGAESEKSGYASPIRKYLDEVRKGK